MKVMGSTVEIRSASWESLWRDLENERPGKLGVDQAEEFDHAKRSYSRVRGYQDKGRGSCGGLSIGSIEIPRLPRHSRVMHVPWGLKSEKGRQVLHSVHLEVVKAGVTVDIP